MRPTIFSGTARGKYHPPEMGLIIMAYAASTLFSDGAENREQDAFVHALHAYTTVYHHVYPAKNGYLTILWLVYTGWCAFYADER